MVTVHHEGTCHAPLEITFAYLDDYRTTTQWMFRLSAFEPKGSQDQGLGAVFDGTFQVKPVKLHSTKTSVIVDFTYELPGGLAGRALGRVLEPIVAFSVRHSDAELRKNVEARYAARG